MADEKIKVLLINHSDTAGGASVVTRRLMDALCTIGVDVRMLVVHKDSDSLRVDTVTSPLKARIPFLAEHADIFMRNGFSRDTLFRISTARFGLALHRHPWVRQADIVVLNWINQGMLSLREIRRIAAEKPVVWTMHDQWNMTGVCHYTDGCERWRTNECRQCPLVGRNSSLAHKIYVAKQRLYAGSNIHFVAVSHALADLCRCSPLMAKCNITVIPNAFPVERYPVYPAMTRAQLGLPDNGRIVVMGAARLDDPVKNLPLAIKFLNRVHNPGKFQFTPVFFGEIRDKSILRHLEMTYLWIGPIRDHDRLQSLFAHADIVLSTSVWETLPGTVVEGVSCGAYAITTDNGGQSDIVSSPVVGSLMRSDHTSADYDRCITNFLMHDGPEARIARHRAMSDKFSAPAVAKAYMQLFRTLLHE